MTRVALEIPKVGLVMESARLIRWLKNVGEVVAQGEPLLELETEKSVVEIESTESGRLVEILLEANQEARVGDRVAWIENDTVGAAADIRAAPPPVAGGPDKPAAPTPVVAAGRSDTKAAPTSVAVAAAGARTAPAPPGGGPDSPATSTPVANTGRIVSSPLRGASPLRTP